MDLFPKIPEGSIPSLIAAKTPQVLMEKTVGSSDDHAYIQSGRFFANRFAEFLKSIGEDIRRMSRVLDFGCGAGRAIRWFSLLEHLDAYGTDYDDMAIEWCRKTFPSIDFRVNDEFPPTRYPDIFLASWFAKNWLPHLPVLRKKTA